MDNYSNSLGTATSAQTQFNNKANTGIKSLGSTVNNFAQQSGGALQSVFSSIQQSISSFVRTGKLDFKELMRSILDDLLRLATNKLFKQFLGGGGGSGGGFLSGLFGGGGGGGGFLSGLLGFEKGGYTGNVGTSQVAGVVHGQEFVMPADATRRNRPLLEAMRNGAKVRGSQIKAGETKSKVIVNNYANATVSSSENNDGDTILLIEEIADRKIQERVPKMLGQQQRNPNSRLSKAQGQSTKTKRRRQ